MSCQEYNGDLHHIEDSSSMSKWGMNFPIGEGTFVTINEGENQPVIRISYYEHSQKPNGDYVIIPKHVGVKLTLKQFSRLISHGPLMCSAITTLTESKQRIKKSVRLSNSKLRSMRKICKVRKCKPFVRKSKTIEKSVQTDNNEENNKLVIDV